MCNSVTWAPKHVHIFFSMINHKILKWIIKCLYQIRAHKSTGSLKAMKEVKGEGESIASLSKQNASLQNGNLARYTEIKQNVLSVFQIILDNSHSSIHHELFSLFQEQLMFSNGVKNRVTRYILIWQVTQYDPHISQPYLDSYSRHHPSTHGFPQQSWSSPALRVKSRYQRIKGWKERGRGWTDR